MFTGPNPDLAALEKVDEALNVNSQDGDLLCQQAATLGNLGEYDLEKKLADTEAQLPSPPPLAMAERAMAECHLGGDLMPGARSDSEQAILTAPNLSRAWTVCAEVRKASGNTSGALEACERALTLPDPTAQLYRFHAALLRSSGRAPEADSEETKAAQLEAHP